MKIFDGNYFLNESGFDIDPEIADSVFNTKSDIREELIAMRIELKKFIDKGITSELLFNYMLDKMVEIRNGSNKINRFFNNKVTLDNYFTKFVDEYKEISGANE